MTKTVSTSNWKRKYGLVGQPVFFSQKDCMLIIFMTAFILSILLSKNIVLHNDLCSAASFSQ